MAKGVSSGSSERFSGVGGRRTPDADPQPNRTAAESKPPPHRAAPGLYIVATPIGNAGDLGRRALDVLCGADLIACEDTRVTAKLLGIYGIKTPTIAYHEHNARRQLPRLMERLERGETVALVSDAGTPLISDPGYRLIKACLGADVAITAVPGPSAVIAALVLSGLPTDRFFFQGFTPPKSGRRRAVLDELAAVPGSLVIFESAPRLAAMLRDAAAVLGSRPAAVTREMTKKFEEVRRGTLDQLAAHYEDAGPPKGEVTVVIGPPLETMPEIDDAALDALLDAALAAGTVRDAAAEVAAATGLPRRTVYARAVVLKRNRS